MPGDAQGALGGGEGAGQQRIGHVQACGAIGIHSGVEGGLGFQHPTPDRETFSGG